MGKDQIEPYAHERSFGRPTVGMTLFVAFSIISVSPILLFGVWLSNQQKNEAINRFDHEAMIRAQSIEESVREFIQLKREVLDVTAGTLSAMPEWVIDDLQAITNAQIKSSGSFDSFYVGNEKGVSLVFAPSILADGTHTKAGVNYSDRDYYKKLIKSKKVSIGSMKLGRQSKVANVHVAVPVYQDLDLKQKGKLRGFILGGIKTELIQQVMIRTLKGRDHVRAMLIEVNQRVIADSDQKIPIFTLLPETSDFTSQCQRPHQDLIDLNGKPIRAFCKIISIETLRWKLWITTPQEVITESAQHSISLTIQIALGLLFGVILVAGVLSSWVSLLMKLITVNAQRVSSGLFDITLPKVRWFTPREVIEVGNISLKTLARVRESDQQVRELVSNLEVVNQQQAPLVEAWRQVSEAIEILSTTGEVLFVNPALYDLLQLDEKQTSPLHRLSQLFEVIDPISQTRSIGEVVMSHAEIGLSWSSEVECVLAKKKRVHSVHSSPIFDQHEQLIRVVVIRRDITEERVAQASAAHNDRLAAIGTLAAGMAHEINNPMTYIKMSLDLIQETLDASEPIDNIHQLHQDIYIDIEDAVKDASEGVDRVTGIVRSLLSIARSGGEKGEGEQMSEVDLGEVIQACANLVKPEYSKRVKLLIEIDSQLKIWGRRSELIQVFLNLMINAAQAMPLERSSGNWVKIKGLVLNSGVIKLTISDNAKGISQEDLDHIFDPFFSSKPVGEGTGLGLAVSRGIMDAHHATIDVSSVEGEGTTFTLCFPALDQFSETTSHTSDSSLGLTDPLTIEYHQDGQVLLKSISPAPRVTTPIIANDERKRILIVDDDLLVAKSFAKMLRHEIVMIASHGIHALELLTHHSFDLILSDVMMPEMDGPTFFGEVKKQFPNYVDRFVFITGAAKGGDIAQALIQTGKLVLNKPITKQNLIAVVNQYTRHSVSH